MTKETEELAKKIQKARNAKQETENTKSSVSGYQVAVNLLTNLLGCVLIGASLGVLFQNLFITPVLLTACLTVLGGLAGLWSVIKYVMHMEEKDNE